MVDHLEDVQAERIGTAQERMASAIVSRDKGDSRSIRNMSEVLQHLVDSEGMSKIFAPSVRSVIVQASTAKAKTDASKAKADASKEKTDAASPLHGKFNNPPDPDVTATTSPQQATPRSAAPPRHPPPPPPRSAGSDAKETPPPAAQPSPAEDLCATRVHLPSASASEKNSEQTLHLLSKVLTQTTLFQKAREASVAEGPVAGADGQGGAKGKGGAPAGNSPDISKHQKRTNRLTVDERRAKANAASRQSRARRKRKEVQAKKDARKQTVEKTSLPVEGEEKDCLPVEEEKEQYVQVMHLVHMVGTTLRHCVHGPAKILEIGPITESCGLPSMVRIMVLEDDSEAWSTALDHFQSMENEDQDMTTEGEHAVPMCAYY